MMANLLPPLPPLVWITVQRSFLIRELALLAPPAQVAFPLGWGTPSRQGHGGAEDHPIYYFHDSLATKIFVRTTNTTFQVWRLKNWLVVLADP